jgi:hypothetical protein
VLACHCQIVCPVIAFRRALRATNSAPVTRLQFATAGFTEIAQRIHVVDQAGQIDECPVWGKVGFDDQLGCLRLLQ